MRRIQTMVGLTLLVATLAGCAENSTPEERMRGFEVIGNIATTWIGRDRGAPEQPAAIEATSIDRDQGAPAPTDGAEAFDDVAMGGIGGPDLPSDMFPPVDPAFAAPCFVDPFGNLIC